MASNSPKGSNVELIKDFILIYKSEPCLWNLKSKEYYDKEKRTEAYKRLTDKLKEIDPAADRLAVKRKINCLRTNHRRQKKNVEQARRVGKVYTPKLWYYHLFDFLGNDTRSVSPHFIDTNETINTQKRETVFIQHCNDNSDVEWESKPRNPLSEFIPVTRKRKILRAPVTNVDNIAQKTAIRTPEHEFDIFGRSIATQLKAMPLALALQAQQYIQNHVCDLRLQDLLGSPNDSPVHSSQSNNEHAEYLSSS